MTLRDLFVEKFGEHEATLIEEAALAHLAEGQSDPHARDRWGSDSFRYLFMVAIGRECMTKFATFHGFTWPPHSYQQWSKDHAHLEKHDGDWPDYIALYAGGFKDWIEWSQVDEDSTIPKPNEGMVVQEALAVFQQAMSLFNVHHEGPSDA